MHAFGAPAEVEVFRGAAQPLLRKAKHDPEIHGEDGLGGVEGLPTSSLTSHLRSGRGYGLGFSATPAIEGIRDAVLQAKVDEQKITIISTGPMTNLALFVSAYPNLLSDVEFVFMGGGVGQGNRSAVAGNVSDVDILLFFSN